MLPDYMWSWNKMFRSAKHQELYLILLVSQLQFLRSLFIPT
jgi:hypothetical protein